MGSFDAFGNSSEMSIILYLMVDQFRFVDSLILLFERDLPQSRETLKSKRDENRYSHFMLVLSGLTD